MDKNKKKILILIGIILTFIVLITIILSMLTTDNNIQNNNTTNEPPTKEIKRVTSDKIFFQIQNVINDYYNLLVEKDNKVYSLLDKEYLDENAITKDNIFTKINNNYDNTSFVAKEIYHGSNSNNTYYFINGYFVNIPFGDEDIEYLNNVSFIVIIDNNNQNYLLKPLNNIENMSEYAKSYYLDNIKINNNHKLKNYTISLQNKLTIYLTNFISLMIYDTPRAYQMLDTNLKEKYPTLSSFETARDDIFEEISSKVFGYNEKIKNEVKIYEVIDDKQNKIVITEYYPNDYSLSF